jgi:Trypsin-co-occurring domain 1
MDQPGGRGVRASLVAAPVTGVESWIGRERVREDVLNGLPTALVRLGGVMAEFMRFTLDDGSEVLFESAESDLVALHGCAPEVRDGGKLTARLQGVAEAAEEVAGSLRARLVPDEVSLEFGLKVSGGVNWFFAKAQGEGTIKVTLKWAGNPASAGPPGTEEDAGQG